MARPRAKGLSWLLMNGIRGRMLAKGQRGRKRTTVSMAKLKDEEAIRRSHHLTKNSFRQNRVEEKLRKMDCEP